MTVVPQVLRNVRESVSVKIWAISKGLKVPSKRVEEKLADKGRVFLRFSGTEPLVRILVEGPDREEIDKAAEELASVSFTVSSREHEIHISKNSVGRQY